MAPMHLIAHSPRSTAVDDGMGFERLLTSLSTRFASIEREPLASALDYALEQVCLAMNADRSTLIEFDENGIIHTSHSRQRPGLEDPREDVELESWRWLACRLLNHEVVTVSGFDELPGEALAEREYARRSGMCSILAVPVTIGDRAVCALMVGSFKRSCDWRAPTLDRARLLAGSLANALARKRADEELRRALAEVGRLRDQLKDENAYLRREVTTLQGSSLIVGASQALRHALDEASKVASTPATVLLLGETGTGKELFASQIHDLSPRRARTMVRINCSAIPSALIESELFGREKGAYTGALSRQAGRFEVADKSTLFLDEIGDLPLEMQIKLLRVLQERQIERLGSSKPINVDVRIVAATNRDLEKGIAQGTFREDLYYRLNVFPIRIPPLRERPDDIPMLVWGFVDELGKMFGRRIESISKDSMLGLQRYHWPGNVRELRNVVERAVIAATGPHVTIDVPRPSAAAMTGHTSFALVDIERDHIVGVLQRVKWRVRGAGGAADLLCMNAEYSRKPNGEAWDPPSEGLGRGKDEQSEEFISPPQAHRNEGDQPQQDKEPGHGCRKGTRHRTAVLRAYDPQALTVLDHRHEKGEHADRDHDEREPSRAQDAVLERPGVRQLELKELVDREAERDHRRRRPNPRREGPFVGKARPIHGKSRSGIHGYLSALASSHDSPGLPLPGSISMCSVGRPRTSLT